MKIEDIVVGKRYRFLSFSSYPAIMLGVGMRKLFTENEFTEKHLVMIENPDPSIIGKMIQEGDNAEPGIWERIVEEDSGLYTL